MMKNIWTPVNSTPFEQLKTKLDSYAHQTGLNVHIVNIPGPICSCLIVVPTETDNNMGLPHTLEHLVFLGSKSIPYRGYLDIFANRCLATGTNAYTAEDHTCFNVSTAGFEGMLNILPVFLDYVLHPELSEYNFHTEIYHVDGEGKELGVVYCEMLGRENTEDDLKDYGLNSLLYKGSGYASYTGGTTPNIAQLTNDMIKEFHKQHYDPSKISILLQGQIDHGEVFKALEKVDIAGGRDPNAQQKHAWTDPIPPLKEHFSETRKFPSEEESVGSVAFAWHGPPITDFFTVVALHVFFRYLQETAAAPAQQRFVERSNPLASGLDFGVRNYKVSQLSLEFDGVPMKWTNAKEEEGEGDEESGSSGSDDSGEDESGSEDSEDSSGSDSEEEDEEAVDPEISGNFNQNLLEPGSMYQRFEALAKELLANGFSSRDCMQRAVRKHKVKFMENLEDEPQDYVSELIIPDILFSKTDIGIKENGGYKFGIGLKLMEILDELEKKDQQFWLDLLRVWLIEAPHVEVIMIPDKTLASTMTEQAQKNIQQRIATVGPEGLAKLRDKLKQCVEANSTPLPDNLAVFPPIPDDQKIPVLPVVQKLVLDFPSQPFPIQTCELHTQFYHARILFHLLDLPNHLRPYLVLFQELLFDTDLQVSAEKRIPYTTVVKAMSDELVGVECGVGLSNNTFATDQVPELFYIYAMSEVGKFDTLCAWVLDVLYGAVFPSKRILTVASNLLSYANEDSRDGQSVAAALCTGIIEYDLWQKDKSSNNIAISVLKQIPFLQQLKADFKSGDETKIREHTQSLYRIKEFLWSNSSRVFAQLSFPTGSLNPVKPFLKAWDKYQKQSAYFTSLGQESTSNGKRGKKAKKNDKKKVVSNARNNFMIPFKRQVPLGLESPKKILTPIGGVESAFFYQLVHCPVDKSHPDCLPILVLGEMISLTEGPLYKQIRGKGYAYDASLSFHLWSYALSLNFHECTSPIKALEEFHQILREVPTDQFLTPFAIDTAKASLLYQFHSGRSSPSSIISGSLRAMLKGFSSIDEERSYEKNLSKVTKEQVVEVYHKYFEKFLRPNECTLVITCNPGTVEELVQSFAKPPFNIALGVCEIKDLLLH